MSAPLPFGFVPPPPVRRTITLPLEEYLAMQRLLGVARSIPAPTLLREEDYPPFEKQYSVLVPPAWREELLRCADAAEKAGR